MFAPPGIEWMNDFRPLDNYDCIQMGMDVNLDDGGFQLREHREEGSDAGGGKKTGMKRITCKKNLTGACAPAQVTLRSG